MRRRGGGWTTYTRRRDETAARHLILLCTSTCSDQNEPQSRRTIVVAGFNRSRDGERRAGPRPRARGSSDGSDARERAARAAPCCGRMNAGLQRAVGRPGGNARAPGTSTLPFPVQVPGGRFWRDDRPFVGTLSRAHPSVRIIPAGIAPERTGWDNLQPVEGGDNRRFLWARRTVPPVVYYRPAYPFQEANRKKTRPVRMSIRGNRAGRRG